MRKKNIFKRVRRIVSLYPHHFSTQASMVQCWERYLCPTSSPIGRDWSEYPTSPTFQDTNWEVQFCCASPRAVRESVWLNHLGLAKNKEKRQRLSTTSTQSSVAGPQLLAAVLPAHRPRLQAHLESLVRDWLVKDFSCWSQSERLEEVAASTTWRYQYIFIYKYHEESRKHNTIKGKKQSFSKQY